jgi:hypothetical protein
MDTTWLAMGVLLDCGPAGGLELVEDRELRVLLEPWEGECHG